MASSHKRIVSFFPHQPFNLLYGGFEVQITQTFDAIKEKYGAEFCKKNNYWEKNHSFDIAHFWGFGELNKNLVVLSKLSNKTVILTALLPSAKGFFHHFRFMLSSYFGNLKHLKNHLKYIDSLVVLSEEQALFIRKIIQNNEIKIEIIPNIVHDIFFKNRIDFCIQNKRNDKFYYVCVGNICKRKNQLLLAKAALKGNFKIVFIGEESVYDKKYVEDFKTLIKGQRGRIEWVTGVLPNSNQLVEYLKKASGFILISRYETQPISILEAACIGLPIMISKNAWTYQQYFNSCLKVSNKNIDNLIIGMKELRDNPMMYRINNNLINTLSKENVAQKYIDLYTKISSE